MVDYDGDLIIPDYLKDNIFVIKGDKENPIWYKETLLNKMIDVIDTDYIIWMDNDLIYDNLDWLKDIKSVVKDKDFVQLYKTINYLDENGCVLESQKSIISSGSNDIDNLLGESYKPGGSWIGKTSIMKEQKFFEKMYVGGGDTIFVYGLFGVEEGHTLSLVKENNEYIWHGAVEWIKSCKKYRLGYLDVSVDHLYHGDLISRNYNDRYKLLKDMENFLDIKPNICLIYDVEGWIFQNKSNSIKEKLSEYFNFTVVKWDSFINHEDFDIVLCYSPSCLPKVNITDDKIICGISSHIYQSSNKSLLRFRYNFSNDYILYKSLESEKKFYAPNGVDTSFFKDNKKNIFNKKVINIGAVGSKGRNIHKGQNRLKKICEILENDGYKVNNKSLFVDARSNDKLTKAEMVDYYKDIDIFIVSSVSEATPNPLLEAMSMGIPCISNNTGMASLLLENELNEYLIEDYDDIESYVNLVKRIIDNPTLYEYLSYSSRVKIEEYDWNKTIVNYKYMFDDFLKEKMERDTTIFIKTFNRIESLYNLIYSIRKFYKKISILIVNDGEEKILIEEEGVVVINTEFDIGLSAGRNIGIENIETDYFLLCDDDFEFTKETNLELLWSILRKSDLDILGGLVNSNGFKMGIFETIKNSNGENILEVKKGYIDNNKLFYRCDYIRNFFMAKKFEFKKKDIKWDERLKMGEHTLFYYSLWKEKNVKVGLSENVSINNKKDIPSPEYEKMRMRSQWFTDMYIKEYGFDKIIINKKIINKAIGKTEHI
jgi:glycosyltransferase involved in cell wall biosynthesis